MYIQTIERDAPARRMVQGIISFVQALKTVDGLLQLKGSVSSTWYSYMVPFVRPYTLIFCAVATAVKLVVAKSSPAALG